MLVAVGHDDDIALACPQAFAAVKATQQAPAATMWKMIRRAAPGRRIWVSWSGVGDRYAQRSVNSARKKIAPSNRKPLSAPSRAAVSRLGVAVPRPWSESREVTSIECGTGTRCRTGKGN